MEADESRFTVRDLRESRDAARRERGYLYRKRLEQVWLEQAASREAFLRAGRRDRDRQRHATISAPS